MQEFNEGDKLTFERGSSRIVAKVTPGSVLVCFESLPGSADVKWMTDMGWVVVSVEKAAPKLPTEPGVYLPYTYPDGSTPNVWLKTPHRGWLEMPNAAGSEVQPLDESEVAVARDLTRLEPVPVTAKKVLDAIRQRIGSIDSAYDFQAVAASFGVTE